MVIRTLQRALALPPPDQRLAVEALAFLAVSRGVLAGLPFRIAMRRLGLRPHRNSGADPASPARHAPPALIQGVGIAVRRASTVAPFKAVCLQQAVAAALMLRRRGHTVEVYFGVTKDEGGNLTAHAWSRCQGILVTGERQMYRYKPISVFIA